MTTGTPAVRGLVLAGVHQWVNSSIDGWCPRPLLPVADSPVICYSLRWLRDAGVRDITICANSDSRPVRHLLADGQAWGLDLRYFEDLTPRGPAGCVLDSGRAWPAREVVVVEGCVVPSFDLQPVLDAHRARGALLTVVVAKDQSADGVSGGWSSPTGVYVFSQRALAAIPSTGYQDIKEALIPRLHSARGLVAVFEVTAHCPGVRDFESYVEANDEMLARLAAGSLQLDEYGERGSAHVHSTAEVAEDVRLAGPVLIGPGTHVARGAVLIGPTVLGESCRIGPRAMVCRSVVWDHCDVGSGALVDRCVVVSGVRVPPSSRHQAMLVDEEATSGGRQNVQYSGGSVVSTGRHSAVVVTERSRHDHRERPLPAARGKAESVAVRS